MKNKELKIGNFQLENPFLLAPLAGITDAPMRRICKRLGAALTYSEMVSGKGLMYGDKNTEKLLTILDDEKPTAFQIFGSEPEVIKWTTKALAGRDNVLIDINMGCPVPKIVKNGEGSALMQNPDLVYDIVKAAVAGAKEGAEELGTEPKPITIKTRIGFTAQAINVVEVAKAAEAGGAAAVAVHGRTREQYYSGKADWTKIADVKKALSIPVIGNGDVVTGEDAIRMMDETGCDLVMIGRGALGNPWIFRDAIAAWNGDPKPSAPSDTERITAMLSHFEELLEYKGEYAAVREMRKQVGWYLKGMRGSAEVRRRVNLINDAEEFKALISSVLGGTTNEKI
ncbi:MAG: tRNA dihydrouridine synthase DusB [Firmicutes bacterium]|nr:tRNA dihydrouridine synthase DusB [Bacillota bacterium]